MLGKTAKLPTRRFCRNWFPKEIDQSIVINTTTLTVKIRHCDIAQLMLGCSDVKSRSSADTEMSVVSGLNRENKD